MMLAAAALGVALATPAVPTSEASPSTFSLDVSGTTQSVKTGAKGQLSVHIKPAEGYKVNEKGPLSLKLSAKDKVALEKAKLLRKDATGKVTSPEFACGFDAKAQGKDAITVDATFVICDIAGTICEMKKEKVEVAVAITDG